jgi:hypothetical protein
VLSQDNETLCYFGHGVELSGLLRGLMCDKNKVNPVMALQHQKLSLRFLLELLSVCLLTQGVPSKYEYNIFHLTISQDFNCNFEFHLEFYTVVRPSTSLGLEFQAAETRANVYSPRLQRLFITRESLNLMYSRKPKHLFSRIVMLKLHSTELLFDHDRFILW